MLSQTLLMPGYKRKGATQYALKVKQFCFPFFSSISRCPLEINGIQTCLTLVRVSQQHRVNCCHFTGRSCFPHLFAALLCKISNARIEIHASLDNDFSTANLYRSLNSRASIGKIIGYPKTVCLFIYSGVLL